MNGRVLWNVNVAGIQQLIEICVGRHTHTNTRMHTVCRGAGLTWEIPLRDLGDVEQEGRPGDQVHDDDSRQEELSKV